MLRRHAAHEPQVASHSTRAERSTPGARLGACSEPRARTERVPCPSAVAGPHGRGPARLQPVEALWLSHGGLQGADTPAVRLCPGAGVGLVGCPPASLSSRTGGVA
mmetsp:Transcript_22009/g.56560  ORF Transcript_22009/g.56560 Transcript_22009/m.56560 type:complete len:106 (-) Transcript_22009:1019-1336(-)